MRNGLRWIARILAAAGAIVLLLAIAYGVNVYNGAHARAQTSGTISGLGLSAPVNVLRDDRGVPHIVAQNEHDLFFAQGYVEGSDRLFQMDLLRRYVKGELAEIFGKSALSADAGERAIPVRAIVAAQWAELDAQSRQTYDAFADGVNAAMAREPLPVEFRILGYRPQPWTPQDSLAVGMATVLDLTDDWDDIAPRDAAYQKGGLARERADFPLTDPCYDAPVTAGLKAIGPGAACKLDVALEAELADARPPVGSNEWAAGANKSLTGRALVANDPHLRLQIPGVWYLIDLRAPGFHAAGAVFPGSPGVILGHNDRIAWGATDGTVANLSAFLPPEHLDPAGWHTEEIHVRFGGISTQRYYRTAHEFGVTTRDGRFVLVRWNYYDDPTAPVATFVGLDRAASIEQAIATLAKFPGPAHNFVIGDTRGRVAYILAGQTPNDPVWSRWFHPASDLAKDYGTVPFALWPKVAASRDAVLWTANNKVYAPGYPLRLSPQFAAPYRAYRIAQMLRARDKYDVAYFAHMQMDAMSLPELEMVRDLAPSIRAADPGAAALLAAWNGEMSGNSVAATLAQALRVQLTSRTKNHMVPVLMRARTDPKAFVPEALPSPEPWRIAGAVRVLHPFSSLGIDALDGTTLPGYGDAFTPHVQYERYSQSFHAVWDVGNWDAGGITLPQGESGEIGSGHYTDQAAAWVAGRLWPLPYSDAAVQRTAVDRETLTP